MIGISFWRILRAALQNFFRNFWLSLATTVIMTLTLLIVLFLYFANIFGSAVLYTIEQKVDLSAVFTDDASEEQIQATAKSVLSRVDVQSVKVVSREDALTQFKERNADKPFIEESLKELEDNPLPASMFIVATAPEQYVQIAENLSSDRYQDVIAQVNFEQDSQDVIEKLINIISTVKSTALAVTILFAVLVVLIMFNTIRLAIYSFREEIDIMRLVGASRWFIRGPFVLESMLVAVSAIFLATLLVYPALRGVAPRLEQFFFAGLTAEAPFDMYAYAVSHWPTVLGLQILLAIGLAVFSSLIAIQRYLRQ